MEHRMKNESLLVPSDALSLFLTLSSPCPTSFFLAQRLKTSEQKRERLNVDIQLEERGGSAFDYIKKIAQRQPL